MTKPSARDIDTMLGSYIETALWSSNDESNDSGGSPLDENYGAQDITEKTLREMRKDVKSFAIDNAADIDGDWSRAGHDFWLTRNRHGAGFWDGDWPPAAGKRLTDAAHAYGEVDLYVHRRKIHAS